MYVTLFLSSGSGSETASEVYTAENRRGSLTSHLPDVWAPHGVATPIFYIVPVIRFGVWSSPIAMVPADLISVVSTVVVFAGFALYIVETHPHSMR